MHNARTLSHSPLAPHLPSFGHGTRSKNKSCNQKKRDTVPYTPHTTEYMPFWGIPQERAISSSAQLATSAKGEVPRAEIGTNGALRGVPAGRGSAQRSAREGKAFPLIKFRRVFEIVIARKTLIVYTERMKKIGIVTGASSGMGEEFALEIARQKRCDEVWLIARRKERLDALCKKIEAKKSVVPRAVCMDISGREGVECFAKLLEKEDGDFTVGILVNNAGFGTYGPFSETDVMRELDMIDLNCTALTGFCGVSLPYMTKGSLIINTASLASFSPLGNFAVYAATKAYVLNFTLALAAEVRDRGIRVCALCPGSVSTEFAEVASNGARREVLHGVPAGRTVAHCLKCAERGKKTALMTWKWKLFAAASRLLGRYAIARFTYKHWKRPYRK